MVNTHYQDWSGRKFSRTASAFTLVEVIVVMGIMALLAALVVGLAGVSGDTKRVSAAKARIEKISLMIDTYKAKKGFYPPDNPLNFDYPTNTSLFYELAGVVPEGAGFRTPQGAFVTKADLQAACGVDGIINVVSGDAEDRASVLRLVDQVASDETNSIAVGSARIVVFVGPEGPRGRKVNPIFYRIGSTTNSAHNPQTYDLWTVVKTKNADGEVVGNWKK